MLYSLNERQIHRLPRKRQEQFNIWRRRIPDAEYDRAVEGIHRRCDSQEFVVSTFLAGHDWTENEFRPLYVACDGNEEQAGWFFGLIVWQVMIDDPERRWYFIKPRDEEEVRGMKYFQRPNSNA